MNIFVILLSFLCLSSGLYFHIGETEKKCFIEDIPDDTMVVGKALCWPKGSVCNVVGTKPAWVFCEMRYVLLCHTKVPAEIF